MRNKKPFIAINVETGERRDYGSMYDASREWNTDIQNITQALYRNGVCCGWRVYNHPDDIRKKIEELQRQLMELEGTGLR